VAHPVYSPDDAPNNIFLFGHLKREIAGFTARSPEEILSEIRRIFETIPREILTALYNEWITRLG
jgi:hypothetical protein